MTDFIELDRHFRDVYETEDSEESAFDSYTWFLLDSVKPLNWDTLLKTRVAIVLGEAGSGKTWEMRNRAAMLKQRQQYSFYIPLEALVESTINRALTPEEEQWFNRWKGSNEQAVFFLDSVDESKIRKQSDFEGALRSFTRSIHPVSIHRVRSVISSRISEWRSHADRETVGRYFAVQGNGSETNNRLRTQSLDLRIVKLQPLSREQVRRFAEGLNLANSDAFVKSLDDQHAWEFARRPIDVIELIEYWRMHGALGNLRELVEFSVNTNIKETPERADHDRLTPGAAKLGVSCLAAAAILCRRRSFLVPDTNGQPEGPAGMSAPDCLPDDWDGNMIKSLLARPIFDVASYGRIRFHHRRVEEYLTAGWLNDRMDQGCPYPVLEDLLFAEVRKRLTIKKSMKPVAAWLAIGDQPWNRRVRNNILSTIPDLFLAYGDPQSLPLDYKQELLDALIERYGDRSRIYSEQTPESLSRLADPELCPYINEKIADRSLPLDLRILMLELARYGRLEPCADAILEIIASPEEQEEIKLYGVAAIRDIQDDRARQRLCEITEAWEYIEFGMCGTLCEALYPFVIGPDGLIGLLKKAQQGRRNADGLQYSLRYHLGKSMPDEHASALLKGVLGLAEEPPYILYEGKDTPISARFHWIGGIMPLMLTKLLEWLRLDGEDAYLAARSIWLLNFFDRIDRRSTDSDEDIKRLVGRHPEVRRAYIWLSAEEDFKRNPGRSHPWDHVLHYDDVVSLQKDDIGWLVEDVGKRPAARDREIALRLAISLWHRSGRKLAVRLQIRRAAKKDPDLYRVYKTEASFGVYARLRRFYFRRGINTWGYKLRCLKRGLREGTDRIRDQIWFWRNLPRLRNGTAVRALSVLASEVTGHSNRWGIEDTKELIEKRGRVIAEAAAEGWMRAWKTFTPLLPHEKPNTNQTDTRVIVGLSGINIAVARVADYLSRLNDDESSLACRYAVNELNGFAFWLPELAESHPRVVLYVLAECIQGEWLIPGERQYFHEVTGRLSRERETLRVLAAPTILDLLRSGDPLHFRVLDGALTVLLQLLEPPRGELAGLAKQRLSTLTPDNPAFVLWLAVWMQTDAHSAMDFLKALLSSTMNPVDLMVSLCITLDTRHGLHGPLTSDPDYMTPSCLREFIPLVYSYVRFEEDIDRLGGEAYTPTARDHAQDFRNGLIERLAQIPGQEADNVLERLAQSEQFNWYRDKILHLLDQRAEATADGPPWVPGDIREFMKEHEVSPRSDHDLFKIACKRFMAIKDDVERGEVSCRSDLHPDDKEKRLRMWLTRKLRESSKSRYTVPQEEEIDLEQRPDIRIEHPGMRPVSIELKWAHHESFTELEEGLTDQLVGQYLRAPNSNYGIYVLGYFSRQKKYWEDKPAGKKLNFADLISHLQDIAKIIVKERTDVDGVEVFGIDFSQQGEGTGRS
jgi:hypothetical protein